ncbi:MAG: HIT family protein [Candidatus Woesearchaeota archaeon]
MCIFCEFISGKRKTHTNGFRFSKLCEMEHTLSFLSIDFPKTADGHMLVVPKRHFERLEDIPKYILDELMRHVALSSRVMDAQFPACNVLLNNGKEAGQTVFHVHFHIIPRVEGDGIEIESWKRKRLPESYFNTLVKNLRDSFKKFA